MEEWKECRLGDYCDFQNGYAFKSSEFKTNVEYKIVKIKELKDGLVKFFDDSASVDIHDIKEFEKYKIYRNDVLFALTGDPVSKPNPLSWVGRVSIYRSDENALLNQRTCKIKKSDEIDNQFLYYYFRQWENFYALASKATGSASQANISTNTIADTIIKLPPLPTQQKIARILSTLDDKIELNNKINTNLEQQAGALFKNWFVDFEPFGGKMPEGWKEKTLDSFCSIFTGRKNANASVENGKYKFFTCSPNVLPIDSFIFDGDAIIISGNGAYTGRTRFYSGKFDLYQRTYACVAKENISKEYLYYVLADDEFFKYSMATSKGTKMPRGDKTSIMNYPVKLPPLPIQQKIARILSSLDDKIELNNKINDNLEQQAQAIFKSWFVDFEPFGGEMPADWKEGKLGEFVEIKRGGSPRPIQNFMADEGLRWLKISDVTSLSAPFVLKIAEHIKDAGLSKTVFLKAGSLVLSNSATPGIPKIIDLDTCIHDGWLYFPKSQLSNEYLYLLFREIRPQLVNLGNGSIFTNLKTDILKNFEISLPSTETLSKFQNIIKPIFEKVLATQREIKQLETLRDTLLPKLMN